MPCSRIAKFIANLCVAANAAEESGLKEVFDFAIDQQFLARAGLALDGRGPSDDCGLVLRGVYLRAGYHGRNAAWAALARRCVYSAGRFSSVLGEAKPKHSNCQ